MANRPEIEKALGQLKNLRSAGDFEGQLNAYRELGRLHAQHKEYAQAAGYLEKAARVANYLKKDNAYEDVCQSLIAVYQAGGDRDAVLDIYSRLHLHFNMTDHAKSAQYNKIRLDLVAERMGKKNPDMSARFRIESELAGKSLAKRKADYLKLLRGESEPTVPDEYIEACHMLVMDCMMEGKSGDALKHIANCERIMRDAGKWATPKGKEALKDLRQQVEKRG